METIKVELGDGDYAFIFRQVKHITDRLLQDELLKFRKPVGKTTITQSEIDKLSQVPVLDFEYDMVAVANNSSNTNEIYALHQVKEWSFGTVDRQIMEDIPREKFNLLAQEMNRLYQPIPLVKENEGAKS